MTDDDFDDLDTTPDDEDEGYVRIKKDDLTRVRKAARGAGKAKEELATYKRAEMVREAGIDGLTERQIATLAREAGEDATPEKLRELAVEFKWAEPPAPTEDEQQTEDEITGQTEAANVANGAGTPANRGHLKPEEVAAWPQDKRMRLQEQHPQAFESVLRGDPIALPAGFN